MIHTEHNLKKDLQTWVLPVVLNVRKVTRRNKHLVAHFLATLFPFCPRCLYCLPESLKIIYWYWSFCHNHSPYYFLQFTFLFRYVYTVHSISLNNSMHSSKGIVKGQKKKQDNPAFSEIYLFGDFNRNLKSTIFTMGNQNRSVMTICNLLYNQQP